MDRRSSIPRSIDVIDPQIPMAWKRREMTFSNSYARRASTSSITSSSSDDREEVPIVRQPYRPLSRNSIVEDRMEHYATKSIDMSSNRSDRIDSYRNAPYFPYRNPGSLRSTRSVPAFAAAIETSDRCPIHGGTSSMRRHGSLFDVRSPGMSMLDKKRLYGSNHSLPPSQHFHPDMYLPPHMVNPMMRHHIGMPVIPIRDPFNKNMTFHLNGPKGYPTKEPIDPYSVEQVCCKGHLIVLWIILGVVTVGVILGIIMGVTIT